MTTAPRAFAARWPHLLPCALALALGAASARADLAAEAPLVPAEALRAACGGRQRCRLVAAQEAGTAAGGAALVVFKVGSEPGESSRCERFDWWLADGVRAHRLLHECNDGYGARGIGEDEVIVEDNRFTHTRIGGSAWGWSTTRTIQLSPLAVLSEVDTGGWVLGHNHQLVSWDWTTFMGEVSWYAPACGREEEDGPSYRYRLIPSVQLPPGHTTEGWKHAALGGCSLAVGAGASSMRVVASGDRTLFIEVRDIGWRGKALELWVAPSAPSYMAHCLERAQAPAMWRIRLADGVVLSPAATGEIPPAVERAELSEAAGVLVRLELPQAPGALALRYGGGRVLATSELRPGDPFSLGTLHPISSDEAVCVVREGRLEALRTRTFHPERPVVGD